MELFTLTMWYPHRIWPFWLHPSIGNDIRKYKGMGLIKIVKSIMLVTQPMCSVIVGSYG